MGTAQKFEIPALDGNLQLRFSEDQAVVLRELAGKARLAETREKLIELARGYEEFQPLKAKGLANTTEGKDAQTHDRELLRLAVNLIDGPSRVRGFFWAVWLLVAPVFRATGKILSFTGRVISLLLQVTGYILVTGGMIYFLIYCITFGLGDQGILGTIVFLALNVTTYFGVDIYNDNSSRAISDKEWERIRRSCLAVSAVLSAALLVLTTMWMAMTPSLTANNGPTDSEGEHLGVVVDRGSNRILSVVYPNGSNLAKSTEGVWFMPAPNYFKHQVEWFSLADRKIALDLRQEPDQQVQVSANLKMRQKAKVGDTIRLRHRRLKTENEYFADLEKRLKDIVLMNLQGTDFNSERCATSIEEELSNDIFDVRIESATFNVVKTYPVTWGKRPAEKPQ